MITPDEIEIQLRPGNITAQDIASEEPGEVLHDLIPCESTLSDGKDGIQILERPAFGLLDKEENESERNEIEASEEP